MLSQKLQDDLMNAYQQVHEAKRGHAAGDSDVEKQASQLASDVKYKAKGKVKDGASDEEKKKVFMQILGASPAPNAVKSMARQKLLGEEMSARETLQKKMKQKKVNTIIKKEAQQDAKAEKKLAAAVMGEGSSYGMYKGDGMSFPERLKKKAEEKKNKKKMSEDAKMGRMSDDDLGKAHKKFSGMDQSIPSNKFMLKRIEKEQNKRKKVTESLGDSIKEVSKTVQGSSKKPEKQTKRMKTGGDGTAYMGESKKTDAVKNFLDKKAKKLEKKNAAQPDRYKNNPAFDSTSPDSKSKDLARTRAEGVTFQQFQEKCWAGYEKKGMKTMFGKRYPNCVKKKK